MKKQRSKDYKADITGLMVALIMLLIIPILADLFRAEVSISIDQKLLSAPPSEYFDAIAAKLDLLKTLLFGLFVLTGFIVKWILDHVGAVSPIQQLALFLFGCLSVTSATQLYNAHLDLTNLAISGAVKLLDSGSVGGSTGAILFFMSIIDGFLFASCILRKQVSNISDTDQNQNEVS